MFFDDPIVAALHKRPSKRPTVSELLDALEHAREAMDGPPTLRALRFAAAR